MSRRHEDQFEELIKQGFFSVKRDGTITRHLRMGPRGTVEVLPKPRLVTSKDQMGNRYVETTLDGTTVRIPVARIIWRHFKGPIPEFMRVHHKLGDRSDCSLKSLYLKD